MCPVHPGRRPIGLSQQQDQEDQGNRNSDQPEQNGHVLSFRVARVIQTVRRRRPVQMPSRRLPPSVAARLAQKAPSSSEAVSQNARWAAFLRAVSRSDLIWTTTSLTRLSASAWLRPVRAATTRDT